jgi:REP element-mobilizing transposase RayT
MARGDRREEIFRDDPDRLKFLGYLFEGVERYRVKAHCFVLMENHFHLVVTTTHRDGDQSQRNAAPGILRDWKLTPVYRIGGYADG